MKDSWQPKKEEELQKDFAEKAEPRILWGASNKYFIPDIEDLRFGYEYEQFFEHLDPQWRLIEINDYLDMEIDLESIRVPYLTKEQIEAEGWLPNGIGGDTDGVYFRKSDTIGMIFDNNKHSIQIYDINPVEDWNLYKGECKSINEFRYICKLLKI